jgi:hypothetical protein
MSETNEGQLRFHLQNLDLDRGEATVEHLVEEALNEAITTAGDKEDVDAKLQPEGKFLGVGETVVVLWMVHALKVGGVAFATGALTEAGKDFYARFLAPALLKRNLLPNKPQEIAPGEKTEKP